MSGECDECGGEVTAKDKRGWYRDKCWNCIVDAAHISGDEPRNPDPPEY